ncbi:MULTISPECIES: MurR/RpiR family transcriptional regulator [Aerococcus]|uniref:MurR/RpiR family transcriptional regulator n=1 Tax=Aerococcus TaxID=1375 RepID=UPI000DCC4D33|nr:MULTISPECIES: MurR/RpiR family transcriptional regulator [Aerococcus]KAA9234454.1 MurR/RpiR family transcriptional regulator [Aerococcus mictus]MDK6292021.1 MurR/RpiR family transcriptional regulator [Aerococcus urinae]MDK6374457.1 MurR/RpiR family transcriptional regulator [Aerococcus urinae]MDK6421565.1 MurR/RpiR family transcriptional regulator [Aerococcus urinae]MDK8075093.1 MurR/RpiR family transcriptional regulator [Aerococcus urinae]
MKKFTDSIIPLIEASYESLSPGEKIIGDYFIQADPGEGDLAVDQLGKKLHVSDSTFTRFAKKLGFKGYREFLFEYQQMPSHRGIESSNKHTMRVLSDYNAIINKSYNLLDENDIHDLVNALINQDQNVVVNAKSCVLAFSVSGHTEVINQALHAAKQNQAYTVLFTAHSNANKNQDLDNLIKIASVKNPNFGNRISPQLPLIVMCDVIYDYLMEEDRFKRQANFQQSLKSLNVKPDHNNLYIKEKKEIDSK